MIRRINSKTWLLSAKSAGGFSIKILCITRHAITNHGSLLQTIATQRAIEEMGHDCKIIDYIRLDETIFRQELTMLQRKKNWNRSNVKKAIYLMARVPQSVLAGCCFFVARKKYLHLTQRFLSERELNENPPETDIYLTGSDQVWGPVANGEYDMAYCFAFGNGNIKRIAFAASFGDSMIPDAAATEFKHCLSRYHHITVREKSAVLLLRQWGIEAAQVLDPTLLLPSSVWNEYINIAKKKEKKYMLVYQIHNNEDVSEYAKRAAKMKGMKLIRISPMLHQCFRGGSFRWVLDVKRFLFYIKNAECVITDSFHGTAFSILFNKAFVDVLRCDRPNTRVRELLELTGLSHRIAGDNQNENLVDESIDFSFANAILQEKRAESLAALKGMIED